jgi:hypothetical protein
MVGPHSTSKRSIAVENGAIKYASTHSTPTPPEGYLAYVKFKEKIGETAVGLDTWSAEIEVTKKEAAYFRNAPPQLENPSKCASNRTESTRRSFVPIIASST